MCVCVYLYVLGWRIGNIDGLEVLQPGTCIWLKEDARLLDLGGSRFPSHLSFAALRRRGNCCCLYHTPLFCYLKKEATRLIHSFNLYVAVAWIMVT